MVLNFCLFFAIGRILKAVIEKQKRCRKRFKQVQIPNLKGGAALDFEVKAYAEIE